jgi:hypothetical protein
MNTEKLVKQFAALDLVLKIAKTPPVNKDIISLGIKRARKDNARSEYFELWPGPEDNIISVIDADKHFQQIILHMSEPKREFNVDITLTKWQMKEFTRMGQVAWLQKNYPAEVRSRSVFQHRDGTLYVKRTTPAGSRHVLLGRDERQLFMEDVARNINTVAQAHKGLKPNTVTFFEGVVGKCPRQGEWFFVPLTLDELEALAKGFEKKRFTIERNISLGDATGIRGGKPHTASEVVRVPGRLVENGFTVRGRPEVIVKGAVRHADHKSRQLSNWHKVVRNSEREFVGKGESNTVVAPQAGSTGRVTIGGITYVD